VKIKLACHLQQLHHLNHLFPYDLLHGTVTSLYYIATNGGGGSGI